jgi:cellobiose phosphorylase
MHTQPWAVIANTILGNGNRAYEYLRAFLPAAQNTKADKMEIEPYVLCQSTHADESPLFGVSRIPWLSGSATWTFHAITHYILGIKPDYYELEIDPVIPEHWPQIDITRTIRGMQINIQILNKNKVQRGVKSIDVNDQVIKTGKIPYHLLQDGCNIKVIMK